MSGTLQSIGLNAAISSTVGVLSLVAFGFAVANRSPNVAPRCTARPKETIYVRIPPSSHRAAPTQANTDANAAADADHSHRPPVDAIEKPKDPQDRGNPFTGWIGWVMNLSYDTLLRGVPGTGTRDRGMTGRMLHVNLDGIVLLRFHHIGFKVATLTTVLALGVILPLNLTAPPMGTTSVATDGTNVTLTRNTTAASTLTNYDRTTIANIPPAAEGNVTNISFSFNYLFTIWSGNEDGEDEESDYPYSAILVRLYVVALISWIVYWFACAVLHNEWKELLALRRVYYLENDVYRRRIEELNETMNLVDEDLYDEDGDGDVDDDIRQRQPLMVDAAGSEDDGNTKLPLAFIVDRLKHLTEFQKRQQRQEALQTKRKRLRNRPWVVDPELRETTPNIELFSVLVGRIPALSSEVVYGGEIESETGFCQQALDWQLEVVSSFFDQCAPTQPGFSSSVAAVTILPDARDLSLAWRRWYAAAAAIRRLKFIRTLIAEVRAPSQSGNIREIDNLRSDSERPDGVVVVTSPMPKMGVLAAGRGESGGSRSSRGGGGAMYIPSRYSEQAKSGSTLDENGEKENEYRPTLQHQAAVRKALGPSDNLQVERMVFEAFNYGPEQSAVYFNEVAKGSSGCCPFGCFEGRLRRTRDLDRLIELEEEAVTWLYDANLDLQRARERATVGVQNKVADFDPMATSSKDMVELTERGTGTAQGVARRSQSCGEVNITSLNRTTPHKRLQSSFSVGASSSDSLEIEALLLKKAAAAKTPPRSNVKKALPNEGKAILQSPDENAMIVRDGNRGIEANDNDNLVKAPTTNTFRKTSGNDRTNNSSSKRSFRSLRDPTVAHSDARVLDSEGRLVPKRLNSCSSSLSPKNSGSNNDGVGSPGSSPQPNCKQSFRNGTSHVEASDQWNQVRHIRRQQSKNALLRLDEDSGHVEDGVWNMQAMGSNALQTPSTLWEILKQLPRRLGSCLNRNARKVADDMHPSTYAVVTFTNRQAAIACRHCLADGRGQNRWMCVEDIPVPPLADAASGDLLNCRDCCRPVTMSINRNQKLIRRTIALSVLALLYLFYTVPFTFIQTLVNAEALIQIFNLDPKYTDSIRRLVGFIPGALQSIFLSLCPLLFKAVANFGSNANSVASAEGSALMYYWWFIIVTVFSSSTIGSMVISGFASGNVQDTVTKILVDIASTVPKQTSFVWINFLILRALMILPNQYMLQFNNFVIGATRWQCLKRVMTGGDNGPDVPYRIYVDSGASFLCTVALSFASPLVAPCAFVYFLISLPLLRRTCIYVYRPVYDGGGFRWPFLFDVFVSSMVVGQVLLAIIILLKQAPGPAIAAICPLLPTLLFRHRCRRRFLRAFQDAGLLQTSLLDQWDPTIPASTEEREEYRRFLVDAHRAAYVPVCIAGDTTQILTAEPAVVVPMEHEEAPV